MTSSLSPVPESFQREDTQALSSQPKVARVVSKQGIEAWLVEEHAVPLIAIDFAFAAGSGYDSVAKTGLSKFLANLLDEGAGPYDSPAFHTQLADRAIELHFDNTRDWLTGSLKTISKFRDEAFDLLRLAVTQARLDDEPIERVRALMAATIKYDANDPNVVAGRAFMEAAYPGHPYSRSPRGTLEDLPRITKDDLEQFRQKGLTRDTLKIAVVGAIDPETLARMLDHVFADLPATSGLSPIEPVVPNIDRHFVLRDLDVPQTTFWFGAPGIVWNDPDYPKAVIVNHILGGGSFTSRLWQEVREKRGLTYSVSTGLATFHQSGLHHGSTFTKNERARETLDLIRSEFKRMGTEGPTDEEVGRAKTYLTGNYALGFDTSSKIADRLLDYALMGLGIDYIERYRALIAAVTPDEARAMAKRLYGNGELLIAAAGRPVGV